MPFLSFSFFRPYLPFLIRSMSTKRSYADAIGCLNSLQSNAATLQAVKISWDIRSALAIPEMLEYLSGLGYRPQDLNALNVIHITGTKGKGSTSAFTNSILQHCKPNWKIGLYTSPHLVAVRERIRVNGSPLSEEEFAKYFFQVWDKLEVFVPPTPTTPPRPAYFRFMTLVAFHVFLQLRVDASIFEVGVGGEYDSTNIVPQPIVTGVTALGIDHVDILGKTIKEIAWQKGGIYKEGVPAFSVNQPEGGLEVLRERAKERKASNFIVTSPVPGLENIRLGLAGDHQVDNANLAVHLAKKFLELQTDDEITQSLSSSFIEGLEQTKWPGRCQTVIDPATTDITWFLDGAHTLESIQSCMRWFVCPGVGLPVNEKDKTSPSRVLIFNCSGGRNGELFLNLMLKVAALQLHQYEQETTAGQLFDHVIFCTNITYSKGVSKGDLTSVAAPKDLKTQDQLATVWSSLVESYPSDNIHVLPSIEDAVKLVRQIEIDNTRTVSVLVAGSLHLVGGLIEVAGLSDIAL